GTAGAGRARGPPSRRRARTVPLHVALAALLPPGGRARARSPHLLPARRAATESMLACLAGAHFTLHRSISPPARCVTSSVGARSADAKAARWSRHFVGTPGPSRIPDRKGFGGQRARHP